MQVQRPNRSDVELLVAARSDRQAFGEFYRRHAARVERWMATQTPDRATAADLTAETFAQALVSLPRFGGDTDEQAVAWLFGIARNLMRRYHRRGTAELQMCRRLGIQLNHDADEFAELEARLDAGTLGTALSDALDALPDAQRHALQLRVIDELNYRDAAAVMGTTEQNARIRVSRALRTLAGVIATLAVLAVAVVCFVPAATPPAYALTRSADGTYLVTINDISGVPALNARLRELGIRATALPVTADCTATPLSRGSMQVRATLSQSLIAAHPNVPGLIRVDQANIPAGREEVIGAYKSASGRVSLTVWMVKGVIPSCVNLRDVVFP